MASLAVIGLGFGNGEQVTLRGDAVLAASPWVGYFGLGPGLAGYLHTRVAGTLVDLDRALASADSPVGFTSRAAELALAAAHAHGHAVVAVSGHPCFANPLTTRLAALASTAGVGLEVIGGASALDAFLEASAATILPPGVVAVDARTLVTDGLMIDPRMMLMVWNAAYLDAPGRARLAACLLASHGGDASCWLYRAGGARPRGFPLARPDLWDRELDEETTLIVPARTATL